MALTMPPPTSAVVGALNEFLDDCRFEVGVGLIFPDAFEQRVHVIEHVLHSTGSPAEVKDEQRPHDRPSQAGAVRDGSIDIGGGGDAVVDGSKRLAQQRGLETVGQVAVHFLANVYSLFAQAVIEVDRPLHRGGVGQPAGDDLDERNEVGRVERVAGHVSLRANAAFLQLADQQAGRAAGHDDIVGQLRLHLLVKVDFHLRQFGGAFLHEVGAFNGVGGVAADSPGGWVGGVSDADPFEHGPGGFDHALDALGGIRCGVVDRGRHAAR